MGALSILLICVILMQKDVDIFFLTDVFSFYQFEHMSTHVEATLISNVMQELEDTVDMWQCNFIVFWNLSFYACQHLCDS